MPQEEPDISNFSASSEHKLPAINGAQALQDELRRARGISTGLPGLDQQLGLPRSLAATTGVRRGHVTEIFGPPGCGKTTMGMQIAVNAIRDLGTSTKIVWLAASSPLMRSRLEELALPPNELEETDLRSSPPPVAEVDIDLDNQFIYKEVSVLAHLLVMLMHPTSSFPPPNTSVLVLDGLTNFLQGAMPRHIQSQDAKSHVLAEQASKRANSKRFQIIDNLASALSRLAASRHIAVVVLMNATTAIKNGQKAVLKPAVNRQGWEAAIHTRVTLYRDLFPRAYGRQMTRDERRGYRLAEVTRLNAKDIFRDHVPFVIEKGGLRELDIFNEQVERSKPVPLPTAYEGMHPPPTEPPNHDNTEILASSQLLAAQQDYHPMTFPTASQLLQQEYTVINNHLHNRHSQEGPADESSQMPPLALSQGAGDDPLKRAAEIVPYDDGDVHDINAEDIALARQEDHNGTVSNGSRDNESNVLPPPTPQRQRRQPANKRKAIEIADSEEDEDEDDGDSDKGPKSMPAAGAIEALEEEMMLFDRPEYQR